MSDPLAVAIWRAKAARKTPYVVNVIDQSDERLTAANAKIAELERLNAELKGRIGGLMTSLNQKMTRPKYPVETTSFLKVSEIADAVSAEFGISVIDLQSERRTRDATVPRQVAMYLARKMTNRSFPVIAKFFGNRDHTTAMHAVQKVTQYRIDDLVIDAKIERLERFLLSVGPPALESPASVSPESSPLAGQPIHDAPEKSD